MNLPRSGWMFAAAILLVGINLRPSIAVIGPLLDIIQGATSLSDTGASLLTTLPVALMGVVLFGIRKIRATIADGTSVTLGLVIILASDAVRLLHPGASMLLVTAVSSGIGIAIVQAVMPAVIRGHAEDRAAGLMGLYSTAIMGGALLSGMVGPWLAAAWSWQIALGFWAVPAVIGLFAWRSVIASETIPQAAATRSSCLHRQPRVWLLVLFFGLGTGAYTLVLAWLPPFYTQMGWSAQQAGSLLAAVTVAEVIAGLAVSLAIDRHPDRRPALLMAVAALLVGMLAFALAPQTLAWPAALFAGLGIGALFPLSLITAMDHGDGPEEAASIAAFVQGGGYILAATLPLLAGLLRQQLADLTPAWWLMALLCLILGLIAYRLHPDRRIAAFS